MSEAAKRRFAEGRNHNLHGRVPSGSRNGSWRGDEVGYVALHDYIRERFAKTGTCEACGATPKPVRYVRTGKVVIRAATDWANISGKYQRERGDWRELCRSCHAKKDDFAKNLRSR